MNKSFLPLVLLAILASSSTSSADLSTGVTYNTGYNGGSPDTSPGPGLPAPDNNFTLSFDGSMTTTVPVVASPIPTQWNQISGASFISPTEDQTYNPPTDEQGDAAGTYDYVAYLDTNFMGPSTSVTVSGAFEADDSATFTLDGNLIATTQDSYSQPTYFSVTVPVTNTRAKVDFQVTNGVDPSSSINPTGLIVGDLTFTQDGGDAPTPEPGTWLLLLAGLGSLVFLQRFFGLGRSKI